MSGWRKTNRIGTSASPTQVAVVRGSARRFVRSARNAASARTNSTFPNSDGWKRKKPRSSQRFEPRVSGAARKTTTMSPIVSQ
jgi:hypothetical protein